MQCKCGAGMVRRVELNMYYLHCSGCGRSYQPIEYVWEYISYIYAGGKR